MYKDFLTPYFLLNFSLLVFFPILTLFSAAGDFFKQANLFISMIFLFFLKYVRSFSFENFLIDYFFYSKMLSFCFLFMISKALSIWFLFACFVLWLLVDMQGYTGPSKMMEIANSEDLETFLQYKNNIKNFKFVEFYSPRLNNCISTKRIWAEFSLRFSCERFMYSRVEVKDLDSTSLRKFNINSEGFNRTLPVIILFEKDKEIVRFPPYEEKGPKKVKYDKKILRYNKKSLEKYFDLEKRFKEVQE